MSDANVRQFAVGADDDGIRLDRWFKRHLPDTSFTTVAKWARTGQLRIDGARAKPGDHIVAGQSIRVPPAEPVRIDAPQKRERPALSDDEIAFAREIVIHRDAQAIVLNKPPGLATQGGTKTIEHVDGLLDALQDESDGRPKLVHRLDKDTSGALLIARTSRAAAHFAKAFSSRTARKTYWALVVGVPSIEDGTIELPIAKQPGSGGEKMHVDEKEGSPARTRYRVIEMAGTTTAWVELIPYTGRTHQLRVHLAAIGHPIVGDGKYGGQAAFLTGNISRKMHLHARRIRIDHPDGGQAAFLTGNISRKMHLHARRIRIDHPDGGQIDVQAELPTHFVESLKQLGFDEMLGNTMPLEEPPPPSRAVKKQQARQHAKTYRKERKGERRRRGSAT